MAETLAEYEHPVVARDGSTWTARAAARRINSHWECWIEFVPSVGGSDPIQTAGESTQPDLHAAKYWASGITPAYLEGALERARSRPKVKVKDVGPAVFDSPAAPVEYAPAAPRPHALLDPFEVYAQGEKLLAGQLEALEMVHLRDIAEAYDLVDSEAARLMSRVTLIARIVEAVRRDAAASLRSIP